MSRAADRPIDRASPLGDEAEILVNADEPESEHDEIAEDLDMDEEEESAAFVGKKKRRARRGKRGLVSFTIIGMDQS